jgi:hypothetical protein
VLLLLLMVMMMMMSMLLLVTSMSLLLHHHPLKLHRLSEHRPRELLALPRRRFRGF